MFRVGHKAICIADSWRPDEGVPYNIPGPAKNEIVTVIAIDVYDGDVWLQLEEYEEFLGVPHMYQAENFKPIEYASASKAILREYPLVDERADMMPIPVFA